MVLDFVMKKRFLSIIVIVIIAKISLQAQVLVYNQKIWQGGDYAAFTSLVYYKGFYYCTFRDADKHADTIR